MSTLGELLHDRVDQYIPLVLDSYDCNLTFPTDILRLEVLHRI